MNQLNQVTRMKCRKRTRLRGYDYSYPGAYFVTVCTQKQKLTLGNVRKGKFLPTICGEIAREKWLELPERYPDIELDAFIIMPNHIQGIIFIVEAGLKPAPTKKRYGLSEIVRAFKTYSSRAINEIRKTPGVHFWQRSFYDHIIRNEMELNRVREYVQNNPLSWELDKENPQAERLILAGGRNGVY